MAVRKYSSRSQKTTLASAITSSSNSIVVVSAAALMGGKTLSASQRFTVVIDPDTALEEIVDIYKVDGNPVSGNTLAIARSIDGSIPQAHSAGAEVRHMAIGQDYQEANDHINATTSVHGITDTAALATLAGTQTLTNKTLTSPKINENVAVTATATELNTLDGITASTAELNLLDGMTATTTELNYVDGVTSAIQTQLDGKQAIVSGVSSTEIGYLDGVTSAIQTQLDGKQAIVSGVSSTEISYLDGVTSAIQTQLDAKAPIANPTFTGTVTLPSGTVTSTMIADGTISNADINSSAQIAYSKLALTNGIVDADINASAAIDKTKISGTAVTVADTGTVTSTMIANGTIVNADISSSAAIDWTKIAPSSTVSATELGYLDGVTSAVQTQLDAKLGTSTAANTYAPLASPALTGVPTAPTAASNTNTTQIATTAYVQNEIAELIDAAPGALDTLNELAAALGDDANFSSTVTTALGTKLPLAGGTMTGAIAMGSNKITGLGTPTSTGDAATKDYADTKLPLAGGTMSGNLNMGTTNRIVSVADPVDMQDVVTKNYLNDAVLAPSNLTGPITSIGAATSIASQTGTGTKFVVDQSPTIVTPTLSGNTTAGTINGTTIPTSKTLVATDSTQYVVPSQTGNAGKYLTTDGTTSSWATAAGYSEPTLGSTPIPSGTTVTTVSGLTENNLTLTGTLTAGGSTGTSGYYLQTTGTGVQWAAANSGDITTVTAGTGLTGGGTSGDVTLSIDSTVATLSGSQTLSNKTLTAPVINSGIINLGINSQTGTTYTVTASDSGKLVTLSNASAITVTLPPSVYSVGEQINFAQLGAGQVTFAQGSGVTIVSTGATASAPKIGKQYALATAICTTGGSTPTFLVFGALA